MLLHEELVERCPERVGVAEQADAGCSPGEPAEGRLREGVVAECQQHVRQPRAGARMGDRGFGVHGWSPERLPNSHPAPWGASTLWRRRLRRGHDHVSAGRLVQWIRERGSCRFRRCNQWPGSDCISPSGECAALAQAAPQLRGISSATNKEQPRTGARGCREGGPCRGYACPAAPQRRSDCTSLGAHTQLRRPIPRFEALYRRAGGRPNPGALPSRGRGQLRLRRPYAARSAQPPAGTTAGGVGPRESHGRFLAWRSGL